MKQVLIASAVSIALIGAAAATSVTTTTTAPAGTVTTAPAGSATVTTAPAGSATVTIQPEVQTKVKQYITTSKPKSVAVPSGLTVRQGVKLPETVEIQSFPAEVGVTQYRYVVLGDQTVLVNNNREIVEVIR
jgi:hypothetical protein